MKDRIKDLLDKIPFTVLLVAWLGWLGYDYYTFGADTVSPLNTKIAEYQSSQEELEKLKKRVKETQDFLKGLDAKKIELRRLAQELEDTKATLTETLDIATFMKLVLTEAKKVGLIVRSLKPGEVTSQEYYSQQVFSMTYTGAYIQVIGFMDRIASLQKIVRVDDFSIKTLSKPTSRIVELEGSLQLKAFRYLGSQADELVKKGAGT